MPRRGTHGLTLTEAAVLALLRIEGERSGYDLLKLCGQAIGHVWAPARSQLYATLSRLVSGGLVEGRHVEQTTRPDKRLFRLTPAGAEALDAWLSTVEPGDRDAFVLRVFVGGLMPREALLAHLQQYRQDTLARLAELRALEQANTRQGHDYYHHLTLRLAIPSCEASLRWVDEVLAELGVAAPAAG
jgi:DNA-binding PadR family transcriptional regulator